LKGGKVLLSNRVAIITGGATGIGRSIVVKFAEEGCSVAIADVNIKNANETLSQVKERGREGIVIECDITDSNKVRSMLVD
jgi:NAD(P)-dependent dehydrogenase (short-subunit alcohol dehydrogenase family)